MVSVTSDSAYLDTRTTAWRVERSTRRWAEREITCWILSICATVCLMAITLGGYEGAAHWFLVPLFCYGMFVGRDVAHWLLGSTDTFDPVSFFAILIYTRGFIATLLNVSTDTWLTYVEYPNDWRPWVGGMAAISASGYVAMRVAVYATRFLPRLAQKRTYVFQGSRAVCALVICIAVSLTAELIVMIILGGVSGAVEAHQSRTETAGIGQLLMFSEPLPLLLVFAYVTYARRKTPPRLFAICIFLCLLFLITMFVVGLRGSRSGVLLAMFVALGTIHFSLRRIPKRLILVSVIAGAAFIYFYGFYKHFGVSGIQRAVTSASARHEMAHSNRGEGAWYVRLIGGGTNTYTLYRICRPNSDYDYALGETYVGGLARLIPSFIWSDRPPGVMKSGTDMLYGPGTWPKKETSLAWDLTGEAMLNFGPLAAAIVPVITGLLLGLLRRFMRSLATFDARRLLISTAFVCVLVISSSSSRSLPFQLSKHAFWVTVCVILGSTQVRQRTYAPAVHC